MILDLMILALLGYAGYIGYRNGPSRQMYDFFKVFVGLAFASHYSAGFGLFLVKKAVLAPDNRAVLLLIGFLLLFMLYWTVLVGVERYFGTTLKNRTGKAYNWIGMTVTALEVFLIAALSLFILSQFKPVKSRLYPYMHTESHLYPVMEKVCKKVITVGLVDSLASGNGGSSKEILLNTLTDTNTYKSLAP